MGQPQLFATKSLSNNSRSAEDDVSARELQKAEVIWQPFFEANQYLAKPVQP